MAQDMVAELAPEAKTVVYIHGINNKPPASILKCQWDTALFGQAMGDSTADGVLGEPGVLPGAVAGQLRDG
jgi:hypothetical protein